MTMEQKTDEWLEIRKGKFTGSEIYKLMGEPKNKSELFSETAKTYILEKIAEQFSVDSGNKFFNAAIEWGNDNEPLAKKWYERITGNSLTDVPFIHYKNYPNDAGGSPDGYVDKTNSIIEIKCPFNSANHIRYCLMDASNMKSECKEYYYQMQFYMMVMNADYCEFISFDPRINEEWGLHIKRIERNEADIIMIDERIKIATEYKNELIGKLFK